MKTLSFAVVLCIAFFVGACDTAEVTPPESPASASRIVSSTPVIPFQASGSVGGGVLDVGVFFPPTDGSISKLVRTADFVEYTIQTGGLPRGAYTVWFIVFNKPEECLTSPCGEEDLFVRTAIVDASAFWSAGNVVDASGNGYFKARIPKGYFPTDVDQIAWPGTGLVNTLGGEFHLIIKYHGLASNDPDVLYEQLHTLLGSCSEGANAIDYGEANGGVQCFDPQLAVHVP